MSEAEHVNQYFSCSDARSINNFLQMTGLSINFYRELEFRSPDSIFLQMPGLSIIFLDARSINIFTDARSINHFLQMPGLSIIFCRCLVYQKKFQMPGLSIFFIDARSINNVLQMPVYQYFFTESEQDLENW